MAYTLSSKCAQKKSLWTDNSTSTYHQKSGHMFFLEHSADAAKSRLPGI